MKEQEKPPMISDEELNRLYMGQDYHPTHTLSLEIQHGIERVIQAQRDADRAYYEPLIKHAKFDGYELALEKLDIEFGKGYAQARQDTAREIGPLIEKLFEVLEHADFSNGIEAFGIDEGRVRAKEFIGRIKAEWQALKNRFGVKDE